ncbi:phage head completion protein [Mycolicibacterium mageritense]|uniref:Head-to-tail stopper n=1 Tax=Mycolicibacterium mageritense TaxID=53462 RepID=A0AAI8TSC1_MYCME|nr:head-tail adaptor protein [Mycolicibacterium mageritense]BDY27531.1 hypothetical protein hbim_01455 [Mycolicibacterium mageritense]
MSLLDRGRETVTVYPEETTTDRDGNTITRPSATGITLRASVQPISSTEAQAAGDQTEQRYRLRLVGYAGVLGAGSEVEWNGKRWVLDGDAQVFNGSARTAHTVYVIKRF